MTRLEWNKPGAQVYETGVSHGVLYPKVGPGVVWNGLVAIDEQTSGGDIESLYYDGVKYMDVAANEDFSATIEAFSAPVEFNVSDGAKAIAPGLFATQQPRRTFGFSYRTQVGNDIEADDFGYKLHVVYGAMASPAPRSNNTIAAAASANTRTWTITTVPPSSRTFKPAAHLVLDSTQMDRYLLENVEGYLYGRDNVDPRLLSQDELLSLLANLITEPLSATI